MTREPPSPGGRGLRCPSLCSGCCAKGDLIPLTSPPAAPARRGSSPPLGVLPEDRRDLVREIENAHNSLRPCDPSLRSGHTWMLLSGRAVAEIILPV